jgi:integrase
MTFVSSVSFNGKDVAVCRPTTPPNLRLAPFFTPTPKAAKRVLEFFTGQINNDHTRRVYMNATRRFAALVRQQKHRWTRSGAAFPCRRLHQGPSGRGLAADHQAALGRDTHAVRLARHRPHHRRQSGACRARPKYVVKKGKTPVLTADEARTLLDSIPIRKATDQNGVIVEKPDLMGLRDRALIGLIAYSFARVGAALQMKVADYFVQGRRQWVRLHEKGGKDAFSFSFAV